MASTGGSRGMPDAGLVTREPQPDEEHAFGPAVASVAKWRELRTILPNRRGCGPGQGRGTLVGTGGHLDGPVPPDLATEHGAVARVGEGGLPAAAQGASGTGPRATCHGVTVGDVAQGGDAGAVAGVDDARGWVGRTHGQPSASPSTPHRRSRTLPRTLGGQPCHRPRPCL